MRRLVVLPFALQRPCGDQRHERWVDRRASTHQALYRGLRIASDNHFATDVWSVTGALSRRYLLPTLLYYREPRAVPIEETGSRVQPTGFVLPHGDGAEIGIGGIF